MGGGSGRRQQGGTGAGEEVAARLQAEASLPAGQVRAGGGVEQGQQHRAQHVHTNTTLLCERGGEKGAE